MRAGVHWKIGGPILIGLGILVWMMGYLGNTYIRILTEPQTNVSQATADSSKVEELQVTLDGLDFWTCQVGVFQAEENAKSEKSRLEKLGWETQIVGQNPWTVAIGYAHEQGELNSLREGLKEGGVVNVVKHFVVPGQAYKISGSGAEQTAQILLHVQNFLKTKPGQRGDTLNLLEKEMLTLWPKKLNPLQQATAHVLETEKNSNSDSQDPGVLLLFSEYQNTLNSLIR